MHAKITSPEHPALEELCQQLAGASGALDETLSWPGSQLDLCARYGVFEWFLPTACGGQGWSESNVVRGYLQLSAACLTTTFIITQRAGACARIAGSENELLKTRLLPDLCSGRTFATVGISHLTTSRLHLASPVLRAEETANGFRLDGFSPWVTGARHADWVVTGATMSDARQILVALPTRAPGVSVPPPARLVGLSSSHTGEVRLQNVHVDRDWLIAGPVPEVMKQGVGAGTGGLQTSTLAVGLATTATNFLAEESVRRDDLREPAGALEEDLGLVRADLLAAADGTPACTSEQLRTRANSLALRAAEAALAAAKGTGYVVGHPAGRWCREALFFLVWSCPQSVMAANLCELAGIGVD